MSILMLSPDYLRIEYAINPYMKDELGKLKAVDYAKAVAQWSALKATFESLGVKVEVLSGHPELPDMVFAANQIFPFIEPKTQKKKVLLARMRSEFRRPEVALFESWLRVRGYEVEKILDPSLCFEGNGDALIQPKTGTIFGAFGPRTDKKVYEELTERFGLRVVTLELKSPDFYHLDTCFSILNSDVVAYQKEAFGSEDQKKIQAEFSSCIEIDYDENLKYFSGNCFSVNGKDIVLQKGAFKFNQKLRAAGFKPIEVDTSEFIKAGGSVFCMKNVLF